MANVLLIYTLSFTHNWEVGKIPGRAKSSKNGKESIGLARGADVSIPDLRPVAFRVCMIVSL
jgi:hypothetical protein